MKFKTLVEDTQFKPLSLNELKEEAHWVFPGLRDQYAFVIYLTDILQDYGYLLSDPPEGDGDVQRIDYLYLKNYEGYEVFVYYDFKVTLRAFKY